MTGIGFSYRKYIAVIALQIVLVMTVLDVTVVNVALPILAEKFSISNSSAVWIVTIYQLVITMLLLPVSSIGDLHSYKRTFLTGVVVFTLSSALCAGGMQSTARLVGQTLGATIVSSVFALLAKETTAITVCLYISVAFALCAGIFSYTRTLGHKSELHM